MLIIRHPARGGSSWRSGRWSPTVPDRRWSTPATARTNTHPGAAGRVTIRQRLGGFEGRRVVIVGDVLHSRVARSNVAAPTPSVRRSCWSRRHPAAGRGGRLGGEHDLAGSRRRTAGRRCGDDAAGTGRADERRVLPVRAGVLGAATACPNAASPCCPSTRWCCIPGRCCAAWRSRPFPTRRNRRAAAGFQRRARADGGAVPLLVGPTDEAVMTGVSSSSSAF